LIRDLENTARAISDKVFEYLTQNQDLRVKLTVHPAEEDKAAMPPPWPWRGLSC
jgi:hypothetical protein